jgi:hypothetical protein
MTAYVRVTPRPEAQLEEPGGGRMKKRKKHPKGIVRLNILGKTYKVRNVLTFREAYEKCRRRDCDADEFWLPSGKRADAYSEIRHYLPPSVETIRVIDEVVSCDPDRMKKSCIGQAKLSIGGETYEVPNSWSFEEFLIALEMDPKSSYVFLPNGRSVHIKRKMRFRKNAENRMEPETERHLGW